MKTSEVASLIAVFLVFSFAHVFFQTEIIKLGYQTKHNEDVLQDLVEDNHVLQYNICMLESPYSLERQVLTKGSALKDLEPFQVLSFAPEAKNTKMAHGETAQEPESTILLSLQRFFTGKEAEAESLQH